MQDKDTVTGQDEATESFRLLAEASIVLGVHWDDLSEADRAQSLYTYAEMLREAEARLASLK